jgi:hypothetical protein
VSLQPRIDAASMRNAIRWGFLLAGVATVGFRLPRIAHDFSNWRDALRLGDLSATQGWKSVLLVDSIGSLVVLGISIGLFYLLRSRVQGDA